MLLPLAQRAARTFLGAGSALEPIARGQSQTFAVTHGGSRFLLRLHLRERVFEDPAFQTTPAIESECLWLAALAESGRVRAPAPVRGPEGAHVLELPAPETGEPRDPIPCTLLRWVEGEPVTGRVSEDQARAVGELLAELHAVAREWRPPAGFTRPTLGLAAWRTAHARAERDLDAELAPPATRALFAEAMRLVAQELGPRTTEPETAGLIHADLHSGNWVLQGSRPCPIDFGRLAFGPWLYDVAESLASVPRDARRALVESYAKRWPLADGDLRRLEGYFVVSLIEVFGYNAPDPAERDYLARAIPAWTPHLERWIAGEPFLFEL